MGQLWKAVICKQGSNELEDCRFFSPRLLRTPEGEFLASGAKLLEHAWIGNSFCLAIEKLLYKSRHRVLWLGEYAEADELDDLAKNVGSGSIPSKEKKDDSLALTFAPGEFDIDGKFLVNHTEKEYVDIAEYVERLTELDSGVIDPLPILTATGNDRGGGDYFGKQGQEFIGKWAWRYISVEDEPPTDYKEIRPSFVDDY